MNFGAHQSCLTYKWLHMAAHVVHCCNIWDSSDGQFWLEAPSAYLRISSVCAAVWDLPTQSFPFSLHRCQVCDFTVTVCRLSHLPFSFPFYLWDIAPLINILHPCCMPRLWPKTIFVEENVLESLPMEQVQIWTTLLIQKTSGWQYMQENMSTDACLYSACFAHPRSIFHVNIFNIRHKALIVFFKKNAY